MAAESLIEVLLRSEAVHVTDLPLPEGDRNLLASILMKDDEELSAERLEGAVRALRRIQLRRKLERVQRELQVTRGREAGQIQALLEEKMRLKRALMDPSLADERSRGQAGVGPEKHYETKWSSITSKSAVDGNMDGVCQKSAYR